jgi:hypothetical protein
MLRLQFTMRRMMVAVAIAAVVFAGLAWARRAGIRSLGMLLYACFFGSPFLAAVPFCLPRKAPHAVPFFAAAMMACGLLVPAWYYRSDQLWAILVSISVEWSAFWLFLGYIVWLIESLWHPWSPAAPAPREPK